MEVRCDIRGPRSWKVSEMTLSGGSASQPLSTAKGSLLLPPPDMVTLVFTFWGTFVLI